MNVVEAIYGRHSCRRFCKDQRIEKGVIRSILEAGIQAPSGKNIQPWRFAVVDDRKLIGDISTLCKYSKFIGKASSLIFVYLDTEFSYDYKKDAMAVGACIQNMLLAAYEHHIGGCWIGEILDREDEVCEILNVPSYRELMAVLALGVEDTVLTSRIKRTERTELDLKVDFWYTE